MDHRQQVQTVKRALELEKQVESQKYSLQNERAEHFGKAQPQPPVHKEAKYTPPTIQHGCKINWPLMFLPVGALFFVGMQSQSVLFILLSFAAFLIWPLAYYFAIYRKKRNEIIEQIRKSDSYRKQCTAAREEADRQQQAYDAEYFKEKEQYDMVILPQYRAEYSDWEQEHRAKLEKEEQELEQTKQELAELYEQTRIVPAQYHYIDALQYIYDMISTSEYGVREAIESYDKSEQRRLEESHLQEQRQANELAMEQNELLDKQNSIAQKARRDANIASVVGAVQRHNTNKTLKKWIK